MIARSTGFRDATQRMHTAGPCIVGMHSRGTVSAGGLFHAPRGRMRLSARRTCHAPQQYRACGNVLSTRSVRRVEAIVWLPSRCGHRRFPRLPQCQPRTGPQLARQAEEARNQWCTSFGPPQLLWTVWYDDPVLVASVGFGRVLLSMRSIQMHKRWLQQFIDCPSACLHSWREPCDVRIVM